MCVFRPVFQLFGSDIAHVLHVKAGGCGSSANQCSAHVWKWRHVLVNMKAPICWPHWLNAICIFWPANHNNASYVMRRSRSQAMRYTAYFPGRRAELRKQTGSSVPKATHVDNVLWSLGIWYHKQSLILGTETGLWVGLGRTTHHKNKSQIRWKMHQK